MAFNSELHTDPQVQTNTPTPYVPEFSLILPAYKEGSRNGIFTDPHTGEKIKVPGLPFKQALTNYLEFFNTEIGADKWDLTVVNDGSPDNTSGVAHEFGVEVIEYPDGINRGRGYALRTGFLSVTGAVRAYTDADGSYRPETIMQLFEAVANNNHDIAVAHRVDTESSHAGLVRAFGHSALHWLCERSFMAPTGVKDPQAGAKAYSAQAAEQIWSQVDTPGWTADRISLLLARDNDMSIADLPAEITPQGDSTVKPVRDAIKMLQDSRSAGKAIRSRK